MSEDTTVDNELEPSSRETAADGLPQPRRRWAALAIWIAMAVTILDGSIVTMALPVIAAEMHETAASVIWVVNAYQVAIMMTLLTAASIGESIGYRRVYLVGLAGFLVGSLFCAFAPELTILSSARFAQGLGAACVMGVNGALVKATYPGSRLGRGIGFNTMVVATASAAGPSVATAIMAVASWRWLFVINLPLCVIAILIGWRFLPKNERSGRLVDWRDAALGAGMFAGLVLGLTGIAHESPVSLTATELTVGLISGVVLVRRSRGQSHPLIPLDLLAIPILRLSYAASTLSFAAFMMISLSLPFFLQGALHFSLLTTGLLITPLPLAVAVTAPVAGHLVERVPAGVLGGIGLIVVAICLLVLASSARGVATTGIAIVIALCGVGYGLFQTPNNRTMLGVASAGRSGSAGAMLATARLLGQTSGAVALSGLFHQLGPISAVPLVIAAVLLLCGSALSFRRSAV